MVKIYTLEHPITNEIRYVGKTNYSLNDRLSKHMLTLEKNHRGNWIRSLKKQGLKPIIKLIEECNEDDWKWTEIYWISQFRTWGFRLLNSTIGGDSGIISKKCREACNKANKGRKPSKELAKSRVISLRKEVEQFDKLGNYISTYNSVTDASLAVNGCISHITECCNNKPKRKSHKGFVWKYKIKI